MTCTNNSNQSSGHYIPNVHFDSLIFATKMRRQIPIPLACLMATDNESVSSSAAVADASIDARLPSLSIHLFLANFTSRLLSSSLSMCVCVCVLAVIRFSRFLLTFILPLSSPTFVHPAHIDTHTHTHTEHTLDWRLFFLLLFNSLGDLSNFPVLSVCCTELWMDGKEGDDGEGHTNAKVDKPICRNESFQKREALFARQSPTSVRFCLNRWKLTDWKVGHLFRSDVELTKGPRSERCH